MGIVREQLLTGLAWSYGRRIFLSVNLLLKHLENFSGRSSDSELMGEKMWIAFEENFSETVEDFLEASRQL